MYLKIPIQESLFHVKEVNWEQNTPSNLQEHLAKKNSGKERVHRKDLSKSVNLMSVVLARQNPRKDHMRTV